VIRFDAGPTIGLGHATRALALADELERRTGWRPIVVARREALLEPLLRRAGVERVVPREAGYALRDVLAVAEPGAVVISDTYDLDAKAMNGIAEAGLRHLVVDDFATLARWPCDVVVNPNAGTEALDYPGAKVVLRGPRYALLRREVIAAAEDASGDRVGVLVCLGGGAWPPPATALLSALADLAETTEVRVTTEQPLQAPLVAVPPDSLPRELARSAVGVLSGGVIKYEAAACGLASVLVAVVDHQETISAAFARYGSATYAGRLGQIDPAAVVVEVARLLRDVPALDAMAAAGRSIVDGKGAQRAVARLLTAAS